MNGSGSRRDLNCDTIPSSEGSAGRFSWRELSSPTCIIRRGVRGDIGQWPSSEATETPDRGASDKNVPVDIARGDSRGLSVGPFGWRRERKEVEGSAAKDGGVCGGFKRIIGALGGGVVVTRGREPMELSLGAAVEVRSDVAVLLVGGDSMSSGMSLRCERALGVEGIALGEN